MSRAAHHVIRSRRPLVRNRRQAQRPSGADDHRRRRATGPRGVRPARSNARARDHGPQGMPEPSDLGSTKSSPKLPRARACSMRRRRALRPRSTLRRTSGTRFSSLEQQLHNITRQIETLATRAASRTRCPDCVATLPHRPRHRRGDAAPRARKRCRAKSTRSPSGSARGTGRGGDPAVLETIEAGLARVHSALNEMTASGRPRRFQRAISELADKIE